MLARHAESIFWAGRYAERAEDVARLLDVTYHGNLQADPFQVHSAWHDVLDVLRLRARFERLERTVDDRSVPEFLVLDPENRGSIVSSVAMARENFRTVRERLSTEMWEAVNGFHLELGARNLTRELDREPYRLYELIKQRCQTLAGVAAQTMPRDDGYRFMVIGWMIERAIMTCRLVNVRYPSLAGDEAYDSWLLTLRSASALEAFRRSFQSSTNPLHVAAFLLQSATFPRSVLFCLQRAEGALERLAAGPATPDRARRLLGRVRSQLQFADVGDLLTGDLSHALEQMESDIREVANALASQYFRVGDEYGLHPQFVRPGGRT